MPGSTGRTHEAVSTRAPVSTTQSRQTPTGVSFCKWQSVGIGVPFIRAASNTLVPEATCTGRPSIVISTNPAGVVAVLTILALSSFPTSSFFFPCFSASSVSLLPSALNPFLFLFLFLFRFFLTSLLLYFITSILLRPNPHARSLTRSRRRRKTNPTRTQTLKHVRINL